LCLKLNAKVIFSWCLYIVNEDEAQRSKEGTLLKYIVAAVPIRAVNIRSLAMKERSEISSLRQRVDSEKEERIGEKFSSGADESSVVP